MPVTVARPHRRTRRLGRYEDPAGRAREIVCREGAGGSLLVIDRDPASREGPRLLAHLSADEPPENAALVCEHYLRDGAGARCRIVTLEDIGRPPLLDPHPSPPAFSGERRPPAPFRLRRVFGDMSIPALRWTRAERDATGCPAVLSLRDAIGELQSYEPLCSLSRQALAEVRGDPAVSAVTLAGELERVLESSIVLNRGLREATLARIRRESLSMSEIAIRCGRVKRDGNGNLSGETSWLARRLGLLPEGGYEQPTPWIHSDVLAVIARQGLGIAPREVELDERRRGLLATILVLERDRSLGEQLAQQLAADGYSVELARSTEHARILAGENPPRLALLGETEPPREALALLQEIRHGGAQAPGWDRDLPALVLGAGTGELDVLRAFEAGADDYLARTCGYLELRARLCAILRRAARAPEGASRLGVGPLTIDLHARIVSVAGIAIELRRLEFELLAHLAREPLRVFAREELLRSVWGYRCHYSTRTVDSHASRLRGKLAGGPCEDWIVGVRGVGYRLM